MTATEILKHEHELVNLVLEAAEREAESIQNTGKVNAEKVNQMLDFFRDFVGRCHHSKEEQKLFVKLQERGLPLKNGPIAVMLYEHEAGREMVKAIAEALSQVQQGEPSALMTIRNNLRAYTKLLWEHIDKEDHILYPMADRLLTPGDQQALTEAFEQIEAGEMGQGVHERYHQLAHDLARG